ncbi:hypothetical protein EB796_018777 [Bugula neritina]|uniref:Uncharacterized protein n=1 Tax=Bugula neritina TaxID=10212 RepID=A0A7J7JBA6_BUGNE|nr:hypothetical protein EB796_018777 [Bugula neritina]
MKEVDTKKVSYDELQRAITLADPEIEETRVDAILFWAYRVKDKLALEESQPIPYPDLEQRLINGNIKRTTPAL